MRVSTFFIKTQTTSLSFGNENFSVSSSDTDISTTDEVFQIATPALSTNYGDYNIFVSSVTKTAGSVTGNFSRSSISPKEVTSDRIDIFQVIAR